MSDTSKISVRLPGSDLVRIRAAAKAERRTLSSFLVAAAVARADELLGEEHAVPVAEVVSTTPEPEERPLLKLNEAYERLPPHLYDKVDLRGVEHGQRVVAEGRYFRYLP